MKKSIHINNGIKRGGINVEKGILFPKAPKTVRESEKTFCFADVQESALWDGNKTVKPGRKRKMVSHKEALRLDAIMQDFIMKYF